MPTIAATAAARYDRSVVDLFVAEGVATAFPLKDGTVNYVVKLDGRTFAIKAHQIDETPVANFTILVDGVEFDDNAAEAALADEDNQMTDQQRYEAEADALGISVGELTDGEYEDSRPSYAGRSAIFAALDDAVSSFL
jgi:hypothetical protein